MRNVIIGFILFGIYRLRNTGVFSLIPDPVLGGATLLMFGTVAAAGVRIIASQKINRKATLVIALSFAFGLAVDLNQISFRLCIQALNHYLHQA